MWTAHVSPAFFFGPQTPAIPYSYLALAGAFPDLLFTVLAILGIEKISFAPALVPRGCFPYDNHYGFTHSLAGEIALGIFFVILARFLFPSATPRQYGFVFAAAISHFLLDITTHRPDMKIFPSDHKRFGTSLFDHPRVIFAMDYGILLAGLIYNYISRDQSISRTTTRTDTGRTGTRNLYVNRYLALTFIYAVFQALFSFGSVPTTYARFIHAPMFFGQILVMIGLTHFLQPNTEVPPLKSVIETGQQVKAAVVESVELATQTKGTEGAQNPGLMGIGA